MPLHLEILALAPGATIQDKGRPRHQRYGVAAGGAMDEYALAEGQALLGNAPDAAAMEFAGQGGRFRACGGAIPFATSGAPMRLTCDGASLPWRSGALLPEGATLAIGAAERGGVWGYLHVAGGFDTRKDLGSRATLRRANLGHVPKAGDRLAVAGLPAGRKEEAQRLDEPGYYRRAELRALWGLQADLYSDCARKRFAEARFTVTPARDRMGMRLEADFGALACRAHLDAPSDAVLPGDVQMVGEGVPTVLLADRQPTGGYPRIATIISADIAAVAQMPVGHCFRLRFVAREEAVEALRAWRGAIAALRASLQPCVRDPRDMRDLLSCQLVDGFITGNSHEDAQGADL